MAKKRKGKDVLAELLAAASVDLLSELVTDLAAAQSEIRRKCIKFLKNRVPVSQALSDRSEGEIALALWDELAFDLSELDEYGGGDYSIADHVGELLCGIACATPRPMIIYPGQSFLFNQFIVFAIFQHPRVS